MEMRYQQRRGHIKGYTNRDVFHSKHKRCIVFKYRDRFTLENAEDSCSLQCKQWIFMPSASHAECREPNQYASHINTQRLLLPHRDGSSTRKGFSPFQNPTHHLYSQKCQAGFPMHAGRIYPCRPGWISNINTTDMSYHYPEITPPFILSLLFQHNIYI